MSADPRETELSFGPYLLQTTNARLLRERQPVPLTPKAFGVLHYLASRPGRLVRKDELLAAMWPDVLVSDASIKVCVREIRKALGDPADAPTYIETVHRRGYRFVAPVREMVAMDANRASDGIDVTSAAAVARPGGVASTPFRVVGAAASMFGAAAAPANALPAPPPAPAPASRHGDMQVLREAFDAAASGRRHCIFISMDAKGTQILVL